MNDCELFQADFDAYRDGLLDKTRSRQLSQHLGACSACTDELKHQQAIEAAVQGVSKQWLAPDNLWARIQRSVEHQAQKDANLTLTGRRKTGTWAMAAMLVVTAITIGVYGIQDHRWSASNSVASVLVNEFHTFVVSHRELDYSATQPLAIRQWFADKIDFRVPAPVKTSELQLAGGRLCNMLDQRVVSYMYQRNGAWVSLYIMKSGQQADRGINEEVMQRGYGFVDWTIDGLNYSLVGDISIEQLRQIANALYSSQSSPEAAKTELPHASLGQPYFFLI